MANYFRNFTSSDKNFNTQELIFATASVIEFENHLIQVSQLQEIELMNIEGVPIWHFLKTILAADLYKRVIRKRALKRRNMLNYKISLMAQSLVVNTRKLIPHDVGIAPQNHSECLFLASAMNSFEIDGRKIFPTVDFLRLMVKDLRGAKTDLFVLHKNHSEISAQDFLVPNVHGFSPELKVSRWSKDSRRLDLAVNLEPIHEILVHYARILKIDYVEALNWIKAMVGQFLGVYDYAKVFLKTAKPSYLFITEGGHLESQAFVCAAGYLGIKVIEIQHGVLRPSQAARLVGAGPARDGLPDVFLSWHDMNMLGVKVTGPPISHWLGSSAQDLIELGMEEAGAVAICGVDNAKHELKESRRVIGVVYQDGMDLAWINIVADHFGGQLKIEIRTRSDALATPGKYALRYRNLCTVVLSDKQTIWNFCEDKDLLVTDHSSAVIEADIMGVPIFTISPVASYLFSSAKLGKSWKAFSCAEEMSRYLVTQPFPSSRTPRNLTFVASAKTAILEIFEED